MRVVSLVSLLLFALLLSTRPAQGIATPAPQEAGTGVAVTVTDRSGNRLPDVRVDVTGPVVQEARTDENGQARFADLKPGTYRFRYAADGFMPFERELVVAAGEVYTERAALSAMPALRAKPRAEAEELEAPAGEPTSVVVDAFLDSNRLGRDDPNDATEIGCTAGSRIVLHQLRDPLDTPSPPDADTTLYVVEGEGVLRLGEAPHALVPTMVVVIPRGIPYAVRPEGRQPLVVLITEAGVRCTDEDA